MAGRGPAPKPADQRRHRIKDQIAASHLVDDGQALGPELKDLTGREDWIPAVVAWFNTWRTAPQAKVFIATDWQRLGMLVPLVQDYFINPDKGVLAEIRLNEERLGATVVDRQRARMNVEKTEHSATVLTIAGKSARERIAKREAKA